MEVFSWLLIYSPPNVETDSLRRPNNENRIVRNVVFHSEPLAE